MLLAVPFFDELWTGVPVVDAPGIERDHGLVHGGMALWLFVVPLVLGVVIETRLLLWAARGDARRWMSGAQALVGVATLTAAIAPTPWLLALALGIAGPACGCVNGLAQAQLVEAHPEARERALTRWTLAAALGDMVAPMLVALAAWRGGTWRSALVVISALVLVHALVLLRVATGTPAADDDAPTDDPDAPPTTVRGALTRTMLPWWLLAATMCTFLDEILLALATLHLRLDRGLAELEVAWIAALWATGGGVGLVATERVLVGRSPRAVLGVAAIACTIATATWWLAPTNALAAAGLFVVGATTAPLYPIAKARAFATLPGRARVVAIADQIMMPIELATPWLLGWVADRHGLGAALLALAIGPVALAIAAAIGRLWR